MAFIVNTNYHNALVEALNPQTSMQTTPPLSLSFQPQVDMKSGRVLGYEALLRWFDPLFGAIHPEKCIEIVNFYNLTHSLNQWLVMEAIRHLAYIHTDQHIAINICAKALDMSFAQDLFKNIINAKYDPSRLHIEITEHKAPKSFIELSKTVTWLRRQGIKVALDDFGTGNATMKYLTYMDFDTIKIDKSYVQGIDVDSSKKLTLGCLLNLLEASGATLLAEGVETEGEAETLNDMGIQLAQGYLFGRPQSLSHHFDKTPKKAATVSRLF